MVRTIGVLGMVDFKDNKVPPPRGFACKVFEGKGLGPDFGLSYSS
jgi:hypothetical protein